MAGSVLARHDFCLDVYQPTDVCGDAHHARNGGKPVDSELPGTDWPFTTPSAMVRNDSAWMPVDERKRIR